MSPYAIHLMNVLIPYQYRPVLLNRIERSLIAFLVIAQYSAYPHLLTCDFADICLRDTAVSE